MFKLDPWRQRHHSESAFVAAAFRVLCVPMHCIGKAGAFAFYVAIPNRFSGEESVFCVRGLTFAAISEKRQQDAGATYT